MLENADQNNSEHGHFLRSEALLFTDKLEIKEKEIGMTQLSLKSM